MSSTSKTLTRQIDAQAEQFDDLYAADDPFDELWETPLEVTTRTQLVVVLAVGGPHVEAVARARRRASWCCRSWFTTPDG